MSFPLRYEKERQLGKGGGGEVWAVRDRLTGSTLALKVLGASASEPEIMALVREATALSGLEGLGVPMVIAFGTLPDESGARYLVRELVPGVSLQDALERKKEGETTAAWLGPLLDAADQLTVLHRAGLLHGDVKPANIIVDLAGRGTLVDLGLAAPLTARGTRARGLTPRFAAPELLAAEPLTVRAEVYALGASLDMALEYRAGRLGNDEAARLFAVAERATRKKPEERYPSADELASAIRTAEGFSAPQASSMTALPVHGVEEMASDLGQLVAESGDGEAIILEGDEGSGRSTLARRLAWTLGATGRAVSYLEPKRLTIDHAEAVRIERETWQARASELVFVVDDWSALSASARREVLRATDAGAKLVGVGAEAEFPGFRKVRVFAMPPLDRRSARDLVLRVIPSLPETLMEYLIDASGARPGRLRRALARLEGKVAVSKAEIDALFSETARSVAAATLVDLRAALGKGRIGEAKAMLDHLRAADETEALELGVARSRVALSRGELGAAVEALDDVAALAARAKDARSFDLARARTALRGGDYDGARTAAGRAEGSGHDEIAAEAMSVSGVALAFQGNEAEAESELSRAVAVAETTGSDRALAVAKGSLAIAYQRAGKNDAARRAYEAALSAAERASDAWTIATTRLNLGTLVRTQGDLALAIDHLQAAIDMGDRAGAAMCVQQARFNLANLDLYLGRYARARASIDELGKTQQRLEPAARAQLLGLEAELYDRTEQPSRAIGLYEGCALAYVAIGRPMEALEARLEALLLRARDPDAEPHMLARELEALRRGLGDAGFSEHEALAELVHGTVAMLRSDEAFAKTCLDAAVHAARKRQRSEWTWRALEARARLATLQGAQSLARRDTDDARAILEETASRLPRDLREVFWNDPRRRALRESAPQASVHASADADRGGMRSVTSHGTRLPAEDRLARIFEITRDLARERDLNALLARVIDHAIAIVGAERGFVVLADDEGIITAHTARGSKGEGTHQTFSRSVAEKVIETGEPVIAQSAKDDARLAEAVSVHQLMIQSIACIPIRGLSPRGESIGALYLETRLRPAHRFQAELPMLSAFADQAAIAIENARLVDQNQRRAEELEEANAELEKTKERLSDLLGRRTEQLHATRRDLRQVKAEIRSHFGYAGLVGTSDAMRRVYSILDRVRDADVPVLLTGESGSGKEMVARAVHSSGLRAKGPFVGVNCGAIPQNLLESELFGHVRGSFTGADRDHKGLFRQASGGTILLDEIGELPQSMQSALLRVLQEKTVRPVGATSEEPVDVRIVAATNRNLEEMVAAGTFREDLFYRLHVVELRVPALRERADDIPLLMDHFLSLFSARYRRERKTVTREAQRALVEYAWPGNVRQLEHVLLNAWLMSDGEEIELEDLSLPHGRRETTDTARRVSTTSGPPSSGAPSREVRSQEDFRDSERDRILQALQESQWNRVQAAKIVGMPRRTFYRRLKEYGIL